MLSVTAHVSIPLGFISHHISDFQLDSWLSTGILTHENLYDGASLHSFSDLHIKNGLPHAECFKYLQIRHLLHRVDSKQKTIPALVLQILKTNFHGNKRL